MVILRTKEGDLKIAKSARIRVNGIGDVSVDGYAVSEDEPKENKPGVLTTLCIAKSEIMLYAMVEGAVEVVERPEKGVKPRAARSA